MTALWLEKKPPQMPWSLQASAGLTGQPPPSYIARMVSKVLVHVSAKQLPVAGAVHWTHISSVAVPQKACCGLVKQPVVSNGKAPSPPMTTGVEQSSNGGGGARAVIVNEPAPKLPAKPPTCSMYWLPPGASNAICVCRPPEASLRASAPPTAD